MSIVNYGAEYGRYWPMDSQGFLINDTHIDKVPLDVQQMADVLITELQRQYIDEIESIYLRGSATWGGFQPGISDADFFVITKTPNIRWEQPESLTLFLNSLSEKFDTQIECYFSSTHSAQDWLTNNPFLAAQIKCFSLLLAGTDWGAELPFFRAEQKFLAPNLRWYQSDWEKFKAGSQTPAEVSNMAKLGLRVAFEMIMDQVGCYTNSLGYCLHEFLKYYPMYQQEGEAVSSLFLHPEDYVGEQKKRAIAFWTFLAGLLDTK